MLKHLLSEKIPAVWAFKKFEDLKDRPYYNTVVRNALMKWDFSNPPMVGLISKQNGIGKTHLSFCLYKAYCFFWYKKNLNNPGAFNPKAKFIKSETIIKQIQRSYKEESSSSEEELVDIYSKLNFLAIDDMFHSRGNDFERRILFDILDDRWFNRRPTVVTSNLNIEEIASIDSGIADRLDSPLLFKFVQPLESWRGKES